MYKIIALFMLCVVVISIFTEQAIGEERDDGFSLKKKDYKMEKRDYVSQILMVVVLVTLAFVLG